MKTKQKLMMLLSAFVLLKLVKLDTYVVTKNRSYIIVTNLFPNKFI